MAYFWHSKSFHKPSNLQNRGLDCTSLDKSLKEEEEKETTDKLHDVLLHLDDITKCPICFDTLTGDIAQCLSGHGICIPCRRKMNVCPSCKQRFLNTKPTLLAQILEVLPGLCPYANMGCKEIFFSKDHHQSYCEYRPLKCPIVRPNHHCSWRGAAKSFKSHFLRSHNGHSVMYSLGTQKRLFYNHFNNKNWLQQEYLHSVDDNLFLVSGVKELSRQNFVQSVRHIPLKQPLNTYYFSITISANDTVYKHSTKAVVYDECELVCLTPHCMAVPLEEASALVNENGGLEVTFVVTKKKQDVRK